MCAGKIASSKQTNVYQTIASAMQRVKQPATPADPMKQANGGTVAK